MDALFHFGTPDIRPYRKKTLSLIPTNSINQEPNSTENNDKNEIEEPSSPLIYQKKSHFSNNLPKNFSFTPFKCDDEEVTVDVDDIPISPLKLDTNIAKASKNLHSVIFSSRKSKTLVPFTPISEEIEIGTRPTEIPELKLYEKQISLKKQDFNDEKIDNIENIDDCDNDESLNKNFKEKISKMTLEINPIQTVTTKNYVTFAESNKMSKINSSDHIKTSKEKTRNFIENIINNHPYRFLIFAPFCTESAFKKHLTLTYRGLVYSKKCLKGPSANFIKSKQVNLIESKVPRYKTLLLDLDETLVHTCNLKESPEHVIKTIDSFGMENSIGLNIRPFCLDFLEKLSKFYEIFIFTASSSNYANTIINYLDPESKYINGILTRANCMETKNGFFVKDLRIIKNRELKNMILVDNLAHSFGFQIENGIPIIEWHNNKKKDSELKYLMDYLLEVLYADDVREFNKKRLKLTELSSMKMEDLLL